MPKKFLALTPSDCKGKSWDNPSDHAHLQHRPLVPLHAGEIGRAAASMPLALIQTDRQWSLVAVCGLQPEENLFIHQGKWLGAYQPVWLSTYPLDFVAVGDKGFVVLDEESGLSRTDTTGTAIFDQAGKLTRALSERVEVLQANYPQRLATAKAIDGLVTANILIPWPQSLLEPTGMQIPGLHMIDEKKLASLDERAFLHLRESKALPLAYGLNFSVWQTHLLTRLRRLHGDTTDIPAFASGGEINLDFLNDEGNIKFGKLH